MTIAYSKLTAQGQITVPAEVQRRLGIGPGSVLEWEEQGDGIVARRAAGYSSEDIHRALFPEPPEPRSLEELKEGMRGRPPRRGGGPKPGARAPGMGEEERSEP